jgi:hypothetical protein
MARGRGAHGVEPGAAHKLSRHTTQTGTAGTENLREHPSSSGGVLTGTYVEQTNPQLPKDDHGNDDEVWHPASGGAAVGHSSVQSTGAAAVEAAARRSRWEPKMGPARCGVCAISKNMSAAVVVALLLEIRTRMVPRVACEGDRYGGHTHHVSERRHRP